MSVAERRQPGARVPFEALIEIGAPGGTSFEAESVDLSSSGMQLRTAYLPKIGAPLTFRFDAGDGGEPVLVRGEVAWCQDMLEEGGGGEFGVRFDVLGTREAEVIEKIIGIDRDGRDGREKHATFSGVGPAKPGIAVRIHIDGMPAPMRAVLRDDRPMQTAGYATVSSELKMLRLGAVVELEDKDKKTRRPAAVDGVDCEIDPATRIPQLIVRLRYEDMQGHVAEPARASNAPSHLITKKVPMPADVENAAHRIAQENRDAANRAEMPKSHEPARAADASASQQRMSLPVARDGVDEGDERDVHDDDMHAGAREDRPASVGHANPAMNGFADKMKVAWGGAALAASRLGARVGTTVALLSKRTSRDGKDEKDDGEARRMTSAFHREGSGGAGRPRTLRQQGMSRDGLSGTGGGAGMDDEEVAMQEIDNKKVARRRQVGIAAGVGIAVVLGFLAFRKPHKETPIVQAPAPELAPAPPVAAPPPPAPVDTLAAAPIATPAPPLVGDSTGVDAKGNPNPFGTTSVKKGTKMLLRLDGPVTEIKGMQMPNGFVVSIPNRKSLEAAGPLAAKDPRIGSAKVVNQPGGAELTIAFKDGSSPSFIVKPKGDAIEIVLAHEKAVAKKKGKGSVPAKAPHKKK